MVPAARLLVFALTLLAVLAAPAAAHPDLAVASGVHALPAGASLSFREEVHYHRLVGHVLVVEPAEGQVRIAVAPDEALPETVAGPGRDLTVNALLRCCLAGVDTGRTVLVQNPGPGPVTVDLRLVLLHDGYGVAVDDAEPGAARALVLFFALPAAVLAYRWRRPPPVDGLARTRALQASGAAAALLALLGLLALGGMLRYGGGPVVGTLAATADLPWTGNIILTTHSVLLLVAIALWIATLVAWTGAARRATGGRRPLALAGFAFGAATVFACALWAAEYGSWAVPALVALAGAALPVGGGVLLLRKAPPSRLSARPS